MNISPKWPLVHTGTLIISIYTPYYTQHHSPSILFRNLSLYKPHTVINQIIKTDTRYMGSIAFRHTFMYAWHTLSMTIQLCSVDQNLGIPDQTADRVPVSLHSGFSIQWDGICYCSVLPMIL